MTTRINLSCIAAICALGLLHAAAHPCFGALVSTNADGFVQDAGDAGSNKGSDVQLRVKNNAADNFNRLAYVRFPLAVQPVSDATFALTVSSATAGASTGLDWTFNVYGLTDGNAGESWGENTITYNNAPANDTSAGNHHDVLLADVFGGAPLGTFMLTGPGTAGASVGITGGAGSPLVNFINSDTDGQATFIVTRVEQQPGGADTVVHIFRSKEDGANTPATLDVTAAIPEPSTLTLAALGLLGLLGFTRRRRK